jgi:hypothetical protein
VSVTPTEASTDVGGTTTFQIVVNNAQDGVGAAEFRVGVNNSFAEITDMEVFGSGSTKVAIADNGSSVDVEYAFRDTADTGNVSIAKVTVQGLSDGSTGVSLEPAAGNSGVLIFDEGGTGYDVTDTNDAMLSVVGDEASSDSGNDESSPDSGSYESSPDPANFQLSKLQAPTDITQGNTIDVSADIDNTGEQSATKAIEFRLDTNADGSITDESVIASQDVQVDSGGSTTVTFEDIDTADLETGEHTHGVVTEDDSATASLTVNNASLSPVGDFGDAPTDPDGDGTFEDVNGDGAVDLVDVRVLFANRDDPTIQNNPKAFDFNSDGTFDVVDVQAQFDVLQEES